MEEKLKGRDTSQRGKRPVAKTADEGEGKFSEEAPGLSESDGPSKTSSCCCCFKLI